MRLQIGKTRIMVWTALLTLAVTAPLSGGTAALTQALPGMTAALAAALGLFLIGATVNLRVGVIAAALLVGNLAFLDAARSGGVVAELPLLALGTWLFYLTLRFRRHRWWPLTVAAAAAIVVLAGASPPLAGLPAHPVDVRGLLTSLVGAVGAAVYLATLKKWRTSPEAGLWLMTIVWGIFSLWYAADKLLLTLGPAALMGSWLLNNVDRRPAARLPGSGILLALRILPVCCLAMWLVTWWGVRAGGVEVPLRLPMIMLAVLVFCDFFAMKYFKFADRRVMIVLTAAAALCLWQLMLTEPLRQQDARRVAERRQAAAPAVVIDFADQPVLSADDAD